MPLIKFYSRLNRASKIVFIVSVVIVITLIGVLIYNIVKVRTMEFYSGGKGGFYIEIGKMLEKMTKGDNDIHIVNFETGGSSNNLEKVGITSKSYGIVQDGTVDPSRPESENVYKVSELFIERIHILYNRQNFYQKTKQISVLNGDSVSAEIMRLPLPEGDTITVYKRKAPSISFHLGKLTINFLKTSLIHAASQLSSTRSLASTFFNKLNPQLENGGRSFENWNFTGGGSIKERLKKLTNGKLDIVFLVAGAPLNSVREALQSKRIGFISIDPGFISDLRNKINYPIIPASFKGLYGLYGSEVSTFGIYANLIAHKDVTKSENLKLLKALKKIKPFLREVMNVPTGSKFQLDDIDFYELYVAKNKVRISDKILDFVYDNWKTILSMFLLPLVSFMWNKMKKKYQKENPGN